MTYMTVFDLENSFSFNKIANIKGDTGNYRRFRVCKRPGNACPDK